MALLTSLLSKIKKIFLFLFSILRKGFCCRKRCRRNSGLLLPLTITDTKKDDKEVISSHFSNGFNQEFVNPQNTNNQWNDWNQQKSQLMSKPMPNLNTNDTNINSNYYTNNVSINTNTNITNKTEINSNDEQEVENDFFKDMTPEFKKPKKVCFDSFLDSKKDNYFDLFIDYINNKSVKR
jgi:hypothetical protein